MGLFQGFNGLNHQRALAYVGILLGVFGGFDRPALVHSHLEVLFDCLLLAERGMVASSADTVKQVGITASSQVVHFRRWGLSLVRIDSVGAAIEDSGLAGKREGWWQPV